MVMVMYISAVVLDADVLATDVLQLLLLLTNEILEDFFLLRQELVHVIRYLLGLRLRLLKLYLPSPHICID